MGKTIIIVSFLFLFHIIFFNVAFSQEILSDSSQKIITPNYVKYAMIDVFIVIYSNTAGGNISAEEISEIQNALNLVREFFWRNSACQLNLNLSYLEIADIKTKSCFAQNGMLQIQSIENDLVNFGIRKNQYGIIAAIYQTPKGSVSTGGLTIMGNSAYLALRYPFKTSIFYPIDDRVVNNKCIWLFSYNLLQSIEQICYDKSGITNMWPVDQCLDYAVNAGENFSYLGEILHSFKEYLKVIRPWGYIEQAIDMDNDHFPDDDTNLPMDEHRYGSDSTKIDSDFDGLSDLDEYMAGLFKGSSPQKKDTDYDGLNDLRDQYPINSSCYEIPKLTPNFDDDFNNWFLISDAPEFSTSNFTGTSSLGAKIYINWDDAYLYFASETNAPVELHVDLDLNNDGWWHGKDNCRLVVDPFSNRFVEVRMMDTSERARNLRKELNHEDKEMWDDEPEYITRFGRLIDEFSLKLVTQSTETKFIIKIAIPANKLVGFHLTPDKKIGIRIYYQPIYSPSDNQWASVFEPYSFFKLTLK